MVQSRSYILLSLPKVLLHVAENTVFFTFTLCFDRQKPVFAHSPNPCPVLTLLQSSNDFKHIGFFLFEYQKYVSVGYLKVYFLTLFRDPKPKLNYFLTVLGLLW